MSRPITFLCCAICMIVFNTNSTAQIRPIDNTELVILKDGSFQLDNYYSRTKFVGERQQGISTLARYGLSKNFEFQLGWSADKFNTGANSSTIESSSIGIKVSLTENSKYIPKLTAIVSSNLSFDPDNIPFRPSINLLYEKPFGSTWKVNGNFQFTLDELASELIYNYSGNIEAAVTKWQSTYVGFVGSYDPIQIEDSQYRQYLEIGMLFWVYDGVTLYPYYDIGLNDFSDDIFNIGALFTLGK